MVKGIDSHRTTKLKALCNCKRLLTGFAYFQPPNFHLLFLPAEKSRANCSNFSIKEQTLVTLKTCKISRYTSSHSNSTILVLSRCGTSPAALPAFASHHSLCHTTKIQACSALHDCQIKQHSAGVVNYAGKPRETLHCSPTAIQGDPLARYVQHTTTAADQ